MPPPAPLTADETPPTPVTSWTDRLYAWRDRLLRDPRFIRLASRFPLTRPIARRRARQTFELVTGFVYSQVLLACVRLRMLHHLADGPREASELARLMELSPETTERLLEAARSIGLVTRRGGERYGLGEIGATVLGNPGILAMIEHHALLYRDLTDPVALLRGETGETELARFWGYARGEAPDTLPADEVADYSALMAASQSFIAEEVLDAYPLDGHHRLLDVGGGEGAFAVAAAKRVPHLQVGVFDLPAVAERARSRFAREGLENRATATGGDFFADALPRGGDVISLVRIVHDHDDGPALELLRNVRQALDGGGTLLLAEPMAETPGAERAGAAYFGFYLLAMGSGRPRSEAELIGMLRAAGFANIRPAATASPLLTRVLIART